MKNLFFSLFLLSSLPLWASGFERALNLQEAILTRRSLKVRAAESIRLPVSEPRWQKDSQLCWVYTFLSAVETINLVKHPGSKLTFSRAYLQEKTMKDRIDRKLTGVEDYLSERGTPVDAFKLATKHGLLQFDDIHDIIADAEPHYHSIYASAKRGSTPEAREATVEAELTKLFGVLPETTTVEGKKMTPLELSAQMLEGQDWIAYAPSKNKEGFDKHPDPDARTGTVAYYTTPEKIKVLMHDALKAGKPFTYSAEGHVVLIYGGDFDENGNALKYYVKDSYPGYYYEADPKRMERNMLEISMPK